MSDTPKSALSLQLLSISARLRLHPMDTEILALADKIQTIAAGVNGLERACAMLDEIVDAARMDERTKYVALRDLARTRMNAKARARG